MKTILILFFFFLTSSADLIRMTSKNDNITYSIKYDILKIDERNKFYIIVYQTYDVENQETKTSTYTLNYQFKF